MANPSPDDLKALREKLEGIIRLIQDLRHIGRPPGSNVVLEVEPILIASLQNGLNVRQACLQANISHTAFYDEKNRNPVFSDRIDKAEQFANLRARQNIVKSINAGNIADSWKYLERKDPEFKPKADVTSGGQPMPILGGASVPIDDSTPEDTQPTPAA